MRAWIIGYTGVVGRQVVNELLTRPEIKEVTLIGRRELASIADHPNKAKAKLKVVNFDSLQEHKDAFSGHDCGFVCLGTTRKDAGSVENFIKIDHDYVVESCRLFKEAESTSTSKSLMLLTAGGSNEKSFLLYPRTKGLIERHVTELGFDFLGIFRPNLLLFDKNDGRPNERWGENIGAIISGWLGNPKSISIHVSTVARAMVKTAFEPIKTNVQVFENNQIHDLGGK